MSQTPDVCCVSSVPWTNGSLPTALFSVRTTVQRYTFSKHNLLFLYREVLAVDHNLCFWCKRLSFTSTYFLLFICGQVVALNRRILGDDHPGVADSLSDLAELRRAQGKLEEVRRCCVFVGQS